MDGARLKIGYGVDRRGLRPQMAIVEVEVPKSFFRFGHDCVLTSAVRPSNKNSLHGFGAAEDFDSNTDVGLVTGKQIESDVRIYLGDQYYVVWHKPDGGNWHLHVEFDPGNQGVAPYVVSA